MYQWIFVDFKCQLGDTWYHHHQISLLLDARSCYRPYLWICIFLSIPCSECLHKLGITNTYDSDILKHCILISDPALQCPADPAITFRKQPATGFPVGPFKFFRFLPIPQLQHWPTVQTETTTIPIRHIQSNPNYFNLIKNSNNFEKNWLNQRSMTLETHIGNPFQNEALQ